MSYLGRLTARIEGGFLLAEGDDAGGGGTSPPPPPPPPPPARTIAEGGDGGGDTGGDTGGTAAPAWPETWRDMLAGEDADAKKILERIGTPEDLRKKIVNQEKMIRSGAHKAPLALPDGATEEEVAAYRKAIGVPDKADGYGLAFPDEAGAGDDDKAVLTAFQDFMHARHVPPGAAKAAFDFYVQQLTTGRTQRAEALQEMTLEQAAELRKEFPGREFVRHFGQQRADGTRTVGIVGEFLASHFEGEEGVLESVLNARLANGLKVGDYAPFLKGMARMARSYVDDEALIGGDGAGGGQSIDDEYKALIKESIDKPKDFTQAKRARLEELATARIRRDERAGRIAA